MTGDVDVPAVGKVKKEYVVAGVAIVGGIVAYAWWQNARGSNAVTLPLNPDQLPSVDRVPIGGSDNQDVDTTDPEGTGPPRDNAEWTRKSVEYLTQSAGWDAGLVATALGKFLNREKLKNSGTPSELEAVQAAVAVYGQPPIGGPYPIQAAPAEPAPPADTAGPKVQDLLISVTSRRPRAGITVSWSPPSSGATSYRWRVVSQGMSGQFEMKQVNGETTAHQISVSDLNPSPVTVSVWAGNNSSPVVAQTDLS